MNFIIPKNYNFKNKIFGVIDYPTAVINVIWNVILYFIFKNISTALSIKIFLFSTLSFPILLISIVGFNNESPIHSAYCLVNYVCRPKIYLFEKNNMC